ncbi:MAG: hypothetical protein JRD05_05360 [Deltaproteobacteria bacterium]|nr:hypothetical protein [Deltaproteobacteria bacterium]
MKICKASKEESKSKEAVSKCFPLTAGFEIKSKIPDFERGKAIRLRRINHWNTWSISRIALKLHCVPKFEPVEAKRRSPLIGDADIGQISADFERGRFEIGSKGSGFNLSQRRHSHQAGKFVGFLPLNRMSDQF